MSLITLDWTGFMLPLTYIHVEGHTAAGFVPLALVWGPPRARTVCVCSVSAAGLYRWRPFGVPQRQQKSPARGANKLEQKHMLDVFSMTIMKKPTIVINQSFKKL